MGLTDRGRLLYAYRPIPANPMTVALALLFAIVTFGLGPLVAAPQGLWPLEGLCFLPFALVLLAMLAFKPSPTYVFEEGIEISLPLWRRLLGEPRYVPWTEVCDVYPRAYEVAGSFLSPFASSAGTLVHMGIGLETKDGRRVLLRFTPGTTRSFRGESPAYQDALATIREQLLRRGQPLVTTARTFSDEEVLALEAEAREPLVSLATVFLAFFLPPAVVGLVLLAATSSGVPVDVPLLLAAVGVAVLPPAAAMLTTLRRSVRRNEILSEISKFRESLRSRSPGR